jgi:small subunit ribosomal protein S18
MPPGFRNRFRQSKVCTFCVEPQLPVDYKIVDLLQNFLSDRGKVLPRRRTGVCAKHQRMLISALKHARFMALLPYTKR